MDIFLWIPTTVPHLVLSNAYLKDNQDLNKDPFTPFKSVALPKDTLGHLSSLQLIIFCTLDTSSCMWHSEVKSVASACWKAPYPVSHVFFLSVCLKQKFAAW